MGLVKGEGFAVDASVLEANASRYHGKAPEELDWSEKQRQSRAVTEYLAALDEAAEPNPECKVPKVISPSVPRDLHEDARNLARRKMKTKAFARSRDERKRVEMRFAHLKTHHGFERLRLRGLSGARDEFHLAAIIQNLKTLALRGLAAARPRNRVSCVRIVAAASRSVKVQPAAPAGCG